MENWTLIHAVAVGSSSENLANLSRYVIMVHKCQTRGDILHDTQGLTGDRYPQAKGAQRSSEQKGTEMDFFGEVIDSVMESSINYYDDGIVHGAGLTTYLQVKNEWKTKVLRDVKNGLNAYCRNGQQRVYSINLETYWPDGIWDELRNM